MQIGAIVPVDLDSEHGASDTSFIAPSMTSPPKVPASSPDELEALIEEARRRARRRRLGVVAVLGSAGLASAALYIALSGGGGNRAGEALSQRPGTAAGVQYTRTTSLRDSIAGNYSEYRPIFITEAWVRDDGSGRLRTTELPAEWPGPRDRRRAIAANDRSGLEAAHAIPVVKSQELASSAAFDEALGAGSFPATDELSADPAELRDQLEAFVSSGGAPVNVRVFEVGSAVLGKPNTPAPIRATVFKVLSQLPGAVVDRSATDPLGRAATSASISSGYTGARSTRTFYFDPQRSLQLAYTDRLNRPDRTIDARLLNESLLTSARTVSSVP
jgi:hypothetical protein